MCSDIDETLPTHIVLRLSNISEDALRHNIHRLEVRLDAFAIDAAEAFEQNPAMTRDLIFSEAVNEEEEPLTVVHNTSGEDGESGNYVHVIWKMEAFLSTFGLALLGGCLFTGLVFAD